MAIISSLITALTAGTALGGFLATGIGSAVLSGVVGIGLSLAAQALSGTPDAPTQPRAIEQAFAVQGKLQGGGALGRSILLGRCATAGSLVYQNTWGTAQKTPNAFFTQVIALSDWPVNGLVDLWVNGSKVTLDSENEVDRGVPIVEYRGTTSAGTENVDHLWIKFHDGTQTTADALLTGSVSTSARPWQASAIGRGVAYAVVTARINEQLFTGFPEYRFVLDGAKLYDITKDTTAGGSGSHRWNDPATWGGDGDHFPVVQAYNILRGLSYGSDWFYGLQGAGAAQLPSAHWRAQVTKCRATVTGPSGSEATFRSGGEIRIGAQLGDTIDALLTSCQGRLAEAGGVYKIFVGAPGSSVASIDDGDIISTAEQTFSPFFGLSDSITGISGTYPNPDELWNSKTAPALHRADLEEQAGNRRLMADVSFDLVPYRAQVQRLMKMALLEAARARRHTFTLPPKYWHLEPGDVIAWSSTRNGYESKLFRIDGVYDQPNLDIVVDVTEINPADYDWEQETDFVVEIDGPLDLIPPAPQAILDWDATGITITGDGGRQMPGIRLTWDGDDLDDVDAVKWEVRRDSDNHIVTRNRMDQVDVGQVDISTNIMSATDYEVRGIFLSVSGRAFEWSEWLPVTTPNTPLSDVSVHLSAVQEDVKDIFRSLVEARDTMRAIIEKLASDVVVGTGRQIEQLAVIKKAGEAQAASFLNLVAEVFEGPDGLNALAEAMLGVQATVGPESSAGLIQLKAQQPPPAGIASQINILARATGDDEFEESGLVIQVRQVGGVYRSRLLLFADQVLMSNGDAADIDDTALPFEFVNGVLTLADVVVRSANIENGSITTAKIDNGAITTAKIASAAIKAAQIDNAAITSAKIDNLAVTYLKVAHGTLFQNDQATGFRISTDNVFRAICSLTVSNDAVFTPMINVSGSLLITAKAAPNDQGEGYLRVIRSTGQQVLAPVTFKAVPGAAQDIYFNWTIFDPNRPAGSTTYILQISKAAASGPLEPNALQASGKLAIAWSRR